MKYDPTAPGLTPADRADYAGAQILVIVNDVDDDGAYDESAVADLIERTIQAALQDAAPVWHNVSDGLPPIFEWRCSKPCWINGGGFVSQARRHETHGWIEADDRPVAWAVTHWQYVPVPKPPRGEDGSLPDTSIPIWATGG